MNKNNAIILGWWARRVWGKPTKTRLCKIVRQADSPVNCGGLFPGLSHFGMNKGTSYG